MSDRDEGGPAFPCGQELDGCGMPRSASWYGMTLRDYFAAKALQGLVADPATKYATAELVAAAAYELADAMLAARAAAELGRSNDKP